MCRDEYTVSYEHSWGAFTYFQWDSDIMNKGRYDIAFVQQFNKYVNI